MSNKTRNDVQTIYNSTRYEDQSERDYDTYKQLEDSLTKATQAKIVNQ